CLLLSLFYLFSFFFFYRYGHHRDLHSFPTRRSSDLLAVERLSLARVDSPRARRGPVARRRAAPRSERAASRRRPRRRLRPRALRDRKSTRLNSSHDQISYAVFCLKKKKKKTHNTTSL